MAACKVVLQQVKQGQAMYKDEIWHRKFEQAVVNRRDLFSDKQWTKFDLDYLLKVANRVRELSDSCETCRAYQQTLTRLEEELQELPNSKAQRQYQAGQLDEIGRHFIAAHKIAPPRFCLKRWLKIGLFAGLGIGFVAMLVVGDLLLFPLAIVALTAAGALYGYSEDQKFARTGRVI
jgi:hypothetical protein